MPTLIQRPRKNIAIACGTALIVFIVVLGTFYISNEKRIPYPAYGKYVSSECTFGQKRSKLPTTIQTLEDIIPILTSPVVITTANFGYLQIVNNFLKSIENVHINVSIVLVCEDELLFNHLRNRTDIFAVITEFSTNIREVQKFRTKSFNDIVNRRISHVLRLICHGIDTFYLDSDTIWLQSPFPYFDKKADLFVQQEKGVPYCSGMFFIRATEASIRMISYWKKLNKSKYNNQASYNKAIKETKGLRVKGLPTDKFLGGEIYFKKTTTWSDRNPSPVIVHATFRLGPENKIKQLQKSKLWFVNDTKGS